MYLSKTTVNTDVLDIQTSKVQTYKTTKQLHNSKVEPFGIYRGFRRSDRYLPCFFEDMRIVNCFGFLYVWIVICWCILDICIYICNYISNYYYIYLYLYLYIYTLIISSWSYLLFVYCFLSFFFRLMINFFFSIFQNYFQLLPFFQLFPFF